MSKLIIIHPEDPSTEFLDQIIKVVIKEFPKRTILLKPSLKQAGQYIEASINKLYVEDDVIFFLGHGRSDGLYGALDERDQKTILLTREDVNRIFANKNAILFSCNSDELLKRISKDIKSFIGFGNMPTDWTEIMAERDLGDHRYLSELTIDSLQKFRDILVSMMVRATLNGLFKTNNFAREMYLLLRLELNKALAAVSSDKNIPFEERVELFKVIQRTKNEIIYKD